MASAATKVTIEYDKDIGGSRDTTIVVTFPANVPASPQEELELQLLRLVHLVSMKSHRGQAAGPVESEIAAVEDLLTGMGCIIA